MKSFLFLLFASLATVFLDQYAFAQDGVTGTVIRPALENAKIEGCKIAKPGDYEVSIGDLIELDYTYPVIPAAIPRKVEHRQTLIGAVVKSPLGFRTVTTPNLSGAGTIAFYFEAKMEGEESITLVIDEAEYTYKFTVVANAKAKAATIKIVFANITGEDIFFFINGSNGSTSKIPLKNDELVEIEFFDDRKERTLAAYDKNGSKVLSLFKFTPANVCILIEKNQTKEKTSNTEKRAPTQKLRGGI